jgi:hypothetical protein
MATFELRNDIIMADHSQMKLGRRFVRFDIRTLKLARYNKALPAAPAAVDWTKGITNWGMMLNGPDPNNPPSAPDGLSDCTIAGAAHAVQVWSANLGTEISIPDSAIEIAYEHWDGYNPADPSTDQGGVELDVLKLWRQQGFAGHKLLAFADPQVANLEEVRQAINLFGGVYTGLMLPITAQTQDVWDVGDINDPNTEPGSWGGHCVFVPKYDPNDFTCITWGALKKMTVAFWNEYCDEAHALLGADWLGAKGSPLGFNQAQLMADLKEVAA